MNHPEKSGSRLFPGDRGRQAVNVSSIDVSIELFLKAGLFAKLNDDGVYAKKIQDEITDTLENMKSMLENTPGANNNLAAQYLADAYAKARCFVLSAESREYLAVFSNDDFEDVAKNILDEVRRCLSLAAKLLGAEEHFSTHLSSSESLSFSQQRKDTIPYGVRNNDDSTKSSPNAPYLSHATGSGSRKHFVRSTAQDFPAMNLAEAARKASLEAYNITAERTQERVSTPPTSRNTMPPPPMSGPETGSKMEALDTSAEAKKYFKKRFLDVYKSEFLKKLRDIASVKSDAEGINKDGKIFEEAFDYICRKTYLQITSDVTGSAAVLDLHNLVEKKVADGADWKSVIRKLGEDAIANEAQEAMRIYVPIITGAYLSHDKYRETILNIQDGNDEDLRTKQEDAANCVLYYIRENMFKTLTSSKLDALVYLGYFFRETRSDLGLIFYEELYAAAGDMFAKIRQKDMVETESETSVAEEQDEEEEMPVTLRGTGLDPIPYTVAVEEPSILVDGQEPPIVQGVLEKGDDENDTDVFTLGDQRKLFPKVTPAAGKKPEETNLPIYRDTEPVITYRADAPTMPPAKKPDEMEVVKEERKEAPRHETQEKAQIEKLPVDDVPARKKTGLWNRLKKSKAGKMATAAAFAATTVLAGYGTGVFGNSGKMYSTDTTDSAANAAVTSTDASPKNDEALSSSTETKVDQPDLATTEIAQEAPVLYKVHLDKIAGDNKRLKNLVEKESFEREPGNRGDFEQLHSIVGQGALTADQQNKLHDELNGKYNRGEYGATTKRFRPLLENGGLFQVLGNVYHPEHSALKAAVNKFGNPSNWSWSRKKTVFENGVAEVKSVPYEELHSEDVAFFDKCQKDFEAVGIGKNGNVHLRNGEAGERIPLKIDGKWITIVETALQIRGIIEAQNVRDIPVPPANILNDADSPADTIPTNIAPVDMEIDLQPGGHGKEGYLHLDTPEIEMGEPVMMAMSDLKDDPEIEIGETEMDDDTLLADIDDGWDLEEADSPAIEVRETEMDDDTLLADIDDGWDLEEIENSIEKTLQKVKLSVWRIQ